jgi:glycosyltransferase involved in cell wall biosynthesis
MPEIEDLKFITQQKPLVSICVLTYNHENFVKEAIESFLMQRVNFDIEIVIHDDASTDQTQAILKKYDNDYPNLFKLLLQSENQKSKLGGGMGPRFNYSRAKGKYIAMCEGDDYWTDPLKLQKQVDFLERNEEFVVHAFNCNVVNEDNSVIADLRYPKLNHERIFSKNDLLKAATLPTLTICFRNILKQAEFITNVKSGDRALVIVLGKYGKGFFSKEIAGSYRKHSGGVSSAISKIQRLKISIDSNKKFEYYHNEKKNFKIAFFFKNKRGRYYKSLLFEASKGNDYREFLITSFKLMVHNFNMLANFKTILRALTLKK